MINGIGWRMKKLPIFIQLTFDKDAKNTRRGGVGSKWCWENHLSTEEEGNLIFLLYLLSIGLKLVKTDCETIKKEWWKNLQDCSDWCFLYNYNQNSKMTMLRSFLHSRGSPWGGRRFSSHESDKALTVKTREKLSSMPRR